MLFTPAEGLNPLKLVNETTASKVIVYSPREAELELQRKLFTLTKAHTLGNTVMALRQQLPNCYFDEAEVRRHKNFVIHPVNRPVDVTFVRADIVGYEVELVLQAGMPSEKNKSLLFDFGHTYADPLNYVNRARTDVYAMFNYTCGRLKSNAGPALIHGIETAGTVYDSHVL